MNLVYLRLHNVMMQHFIIACIYRAKLYHRYCGCIKLELTDHILSTQVMSERRVKVGVLSIQGAFAEHVSMLEREGERRKKDVGITVVEVRNPSDLDELDGLIIPGGESTTLSVFLRQNGFEEKLKSFISNEKRPGFAWGTCAGLILLSDELDSQKKGGQITVCNRPYAILCYLYFLSFS